MRQWKWIAAIGPGILIAATGVGAGDLLTASLGGSAVGLTILWAAWVGGVLKWVLNEGIARWQMGTETTVLEGWTDKLHASIRWAFLLYLLVWTVFTGGALVNACGVAGTGLLQITSDIHTSKLVWGAFHSLLGLVLVWVGGFKLFEKMMSVCIGVMFTAVVVTAVLIGADASELVTGLTVPRIPPDGLGWVLGVLGGVGGTVTLLSYGYWVREEGRSGESGLRACRIDLAIGYAMTAVFGVCMIVIGSKVEITKGPLLALDLAGEISSSMGHAGQMAKWIFLAGFWGAVFSSLLGVWQSVPYLFADFWYLGQSATRGSTPKVPTDFTRTPPYRIYLLAIAVGSLPMLFMPVAKAQLAYAIMGSFFIPFLAATLLVMNNRRSWIGDAYRNGPLINLILMAILVFFSYVLVDKTRKNISGFTLTKTKQVESASEEINSR